jgi:hypothetical protein
MVIPRSMLDSLGCCDAIYAFVATKSIKTVVSLVSGSDGGVMTQRSLIGVTAELDTTTGMRHLP